MHKKIYLSKKIHTLKKKSTSIFFFTKLKKKQKNDINFKALKNTSNLPRCLIKY